MEQNNVVRRFLSGPFLTAESLAHQNAGRVPVRVRTTAQSAAEFDLFRTMSHGRIRYQLALAARTCGQT